MMTSGQFYIHILNQTKAVSSAVHGLETVLLEQHLQHCVQNTFEPNHDALEREKKIEELLTLFRKRL